MEEKDNATELELEEDQFMREVIQGDHELLYLDTLLKETLTVE